MAATGAALALTMIKLLLRWLVRILYGFRGHNLEVLRTPGPVLLVPNHVSWLEIGRAHV